MKSKPFAIISENHDYRPYEDLYIYYVKGRAGKADKFFGPAFIGNWEEDDFSFLFFTEPADHEVAHFIEKHPQFALADHYRMTYEEWQGGRVAPMTVGRFYICPPWDCPGNEPLLKCNENAIKILMDPGVVFGTGFHTTTQDCLEALSWLFSRESIDSVLDLGTGTGLLALAAAKMGCNRCLALDFNFLAAKTAFRNVCLNDLLTNIVVLQGYAEDFVTIPADLLIANIHYDVMQKIIKADGFFHKKWFILSGLFRTQARHIADELTKNQVKIIKQWDKDNIWYTFLCRRA